MDLQNAISNNYDVYTGQDIPIIDVAATPDDNTTFGSSVFGNVKELQVGIGSVVFRANQSGIWLGAAKWADAPFRVDMNGNMTATSVSISGYIPVGGALADIGAGNITGTYIGSGAITTPKIAANSITSSLVAAGAITTDKLTAGEIIGFTVTGGTVRTAASGTRVQLNGSANQIEIYNGSTLRAVGYQTGWSFYNSSGTHVCDVFAGTSGMLLTSDGSIFVNAGTGSAASLTVNSSNYIYADGANNQVTIARNFIPISLYTLGGSGFAWGKLYLDTVGYVTSTGGTGTPWPLASSWSITKLATGRYRVNHPLGTTFYTVMIAPVSSTAKVWTIEDRSSGSFTVRIANTSFTLEDNDFMFQVILQD